MAKLKLLFELVLLLAVFLLALVFIYRNGETVTVDLLAFKVSSLHLGWWLILAFILGGLLGLFARLPALLGARLRHENQARKIKRQEEEIKRLRGEPAKGS